MYKSWALSLFRDIASVAMAWLFCHADTKGAKEIKRFQVNNYCDWLANRPNEPATNPHKGSG
jgi:hypothetical protein